MSTGDLGGMAGSVGQVRECGNRLLNIAKKYNIPMFLVGHVTKEGSIAGPKVLEHMVDVVLELTGERTGQYRMLRTIKNRFGPTDEVGVYEMTEGGLVEVSDASKAFLEESQKGVAGSVVVALMEGTRPMLTEIQALVVPSQLSIPRRVSRGIDVRRVQLLAAVLMKSCRLGLGGSDIFVNVAGGMQIVEPAADLGIALAMASSFTNLALPKKSVVVGEVGLLGEIRKVSFLTKRMREAKKLGFTLAITPGRFLSVREVVKKYLRK
jgi:DNA repair protein RadA/Sms